MLPFGFKKEWMLAPDIDAAFGAKRLKDFGNFGGWGDRIADDAATDMAHDVGDGAVAVDHVGEAGVLDFLGFHLAGVRLLLNDRNASVGRNRVDNPVLNQTAC